MPWPPSGWPPSSACPTRPPAAAPPLCSECSTLTEPGGPAYEWKFGNYWGSISMDNNIIDKSDDIVAQLVARALRLRRRDPDWDKATGKVWGKTTSSGRRSASSARSPRTDDLTICNVRPPASTARPAATGRPRAPPPTRPRTAPPPTRPPLHLGVTPIENGVCNDVGRGADARTPPPRASSRQLAQSAFASHLRGTSTAARGHWTRRVEGQHSLMRFRAAGRLSSPHHCLPRVSARRRAVVPVCNQESAT